MTNTKDLTVTDEYEDINDDIWQTAQTHVRQARR